MLKGILIVPLLIISASTAYASMSFSISTSRKNQTAEFGKCTKVSTQSIQEARNDNIRAIGEVYADMCKYYDHPDEFSFSCNFTNGRGVAYYFFRGSRAIKNCETKRKEFIKKMKDFLNVIEY